jgi:hypothetical protein
MMIRVEARRTDEANRGKIRQSDRINKGNQLATSPRASADTNRDRNAGASPKRKIPGVDRAT